MIKRGEAKTFTCFLGELEKQRRKNVPRLSVIYYFLFPNKKWHISSRRPKEKQKHERKGKTTGEKGRQTPSIQIPPEKRNVNFPA